MEVTVSIAARLPANGTDKTARPTDPDDAKNNVVVAFHDPKYPTALYHTAPCCDTATDRAAAIARAIKARKAAGLNYPGKPDPDPGVTVTVTI